MECKHSENVHIFQSTKKANTLGNITLYPHNSGGFGCVHFYLPWYRSENLCHEQDSCGMKLCQSCQEFSWWEFHSETSSPPTALLDVLLVIISGQWAAIFKRFCNRGKRPSCSHPAGASAMQGLHFDPACQPFAEREVSRRTVMGAWLVLRDSKFFCVRWCFARQDTEMNKCVLEHSVEGKEMGNH